MTIKAIDHGQKNVFGFEATEKLTTEEIQEFLPNLEAAALRANKKLRLLIDVTDMHGANMKAEWKIFGFLKKHMADIEYIAIVGAHSWTKVMSEILAESIFVEAETHYFKPHETDHAWEWLRSAEHPKHIRVRKVTGNDTTLFTQYGSDNYI